MSPKKQQAAQRAQVPDGQADLAWFKAHPDRRHRVRPATQEEVAAPAIVKPGLPFRYVAMRYEPGPGRLKFICLFAKSSVGELDESDARKAFRAQFWEAPAADYAKRGEEEKAVLRVGGGGRGFVVETTDKTRYVLTVAHCLPKIADHDLPPAHPGRYLNECTYKELLAPLGQKPAVMAECLFVDPISDLAILGQPDDQTFFEEADAYDALVKGRPALKISQRVVEYDHSPDEGIPGSLLSLEGHWYSCTVHPRGAALRVTAAAQPILDVGGTSGSPILDADGAAIGAVSTGAGIFPNPRLLGALPGWFLAKAVRGPAFARQLQAELAEAARSRRR